MRAISSTTMRSPIAVVRHGHFNMVIRLPPRQPDRRTPQSLTTNRFLVFLHPHRVSNHLKMIPRMTGSPVRSLPTMTTPRNSATITAAALISMTAARPLLPLTVVAMMGCRLLVHCGKAPMDRIQIATTPGRSLLIPNLIARTRG
ncbi:hypothetical protein ACT17_11830 [Mycolicibacterium conceptionense]|uniref:Uncharacterized protein n=1 Tax=Mycolicibacterium conceptionense TaxID=451644 RepID=A0A0J8UBC4_9MYCO|nr:hypothetical protein ACT17_11830 [Mycolicibacterium conceptionense]